MQISRRVLLACAASLAFSTCFSTSLRAQDSEAQQKARKALDQRIQEINQNPAPAPVTPPKPAPQAKPAPAEKPVAQSKPTPVAQVTKTNPPPAPVATAAVVHEAPKSASAPEPQYMPFPPATNPQSEEKLQEALRRKEMEMDARKAAPAAAAVKAAPSSTSAKAKPVQPSNAEAQAAKEKAAQKAAADEAKAKQKGKVAAGPALEPLPAPPTGLSGSKEQRLDQLLQQYRADKISPEEYHAQRSKIMAEP